MDGMITKNNLKIIRTQKGISQLELAIMTRISPSNLSHIENGKQYCYPGWRKRLAQALNVDEKTLFPEVNDNANCK